MSIVSLIYTILILCIVVVAHEFGHYIVAKSNGIYVKEFWVGFGPTLVSFTKNGTKFCLKPIPFGGACVFEDDPECDDPDKLFNKSGVFARIMTTFAGPLFNIILAFVFSVLIVSLVPEGNIVSTEIVEVAKGSAAEEAGIEPGDIIKKYNSKNVGISTEVVLYTMTSDGEPVNVTIIRDGSEMVKVISPKYSEEYGRYMFGVTFGKSIDRSSSLNVLKYSGIYVRYNLRNTLEGLKTLFTGKFSMDNVSGPVGMAGMVSDVYNEAKQEGTSIVLLNMLNIALLISASLGIMNLLPVPALDGGKLILLFVEAIRHKQISQDKETMINFIGFALLMVLMLVVLYNDVLKFFK